MSIKLSICIPTHDRAAFIGQTLDSIIVQATEEVEIVVSDNASSDNTAEIVQAYQRKFPRITYFRWEENMGADRNFLKVVDLARGDYCWLMGSDDRVEKGGISCVMNALNAFSNLAGISLNRNAYSFDMSHTIKERPVAGGRLQADILFKTVQDVFSMLGEYFGYLSGQVVYRKLWNSIATKKDITPYYNAYVHVYIIVNMLLSNPHWLYMHRKCVGWRSGNDSFLSDGIYRRLAIDVVGYEKIAHDVFGKYSHLYNELLKIVSTVHVRYAIIRAKFNGAPFSFFVKAFRLCLRNYWYLPQFWLITFPFFLVPSVVYKLLRTVKHRLKNVLKGPLKT